MTETAGTAKTARAASAFAKATACLPAPAGKRQAGYQYNARLGAKQTGPAARNRFASVLIRTVVSGSGHIIGFSRLGEQGSVSASDRNSNIVL